MVSTIGEIFSKPNKRNEGNLLNPTIDPNGYKIFCHQDNGSYRTLAVHRAVALAFVPPVAGKNCVNHKDSNRLNNRAENLEWVTRAENYQHGVIYGNVDIYRTRGEKHGMAKLTRIKVINIRHCQTAITSKDLGALYGVSGSTVRSIWRRETWRNTDEETNDEGAKMWAEKNVKESQGKEYSL
jgi:hypothetical protein